MFRSGCDRRGGLGIGPVRKYILYQELEHYAAEEEAIQYGHVKLFARRYLLPDRRLLWDIGIQTGPAAYRRSGRLAPYFLYSQIAYGWDFFKIGTGVALGVSTVNRRGPLKPIVLLSPPVFLKGIISF